MSSRRRESWAERVELIVEALPKAAAGIDELAAVTNCAEHRRDRVVIGAKHSLVAKAVRPEQYDERRSHPAMYYAYWSDLPVGDVDTTIRSDRRRGWAAIPPRRPHRGSLSVGRSRSSTPIAPISRGTSSLPWTSPPDFAERVRTATRESKFIGSAELPGYFCRPFGPGEPITAMGINDAFRDAELVAAALDDALSDRHSFVAGMAGAGPRCSARPRVHRRARAPATAAARDDEQQPGRAMDAFVSVQASTLPAPECFDPANVGGIMAAA